MPSEELEELDALRAFSIGKAYSRRCRITAGPNSQEEQFKAQELALKYLEMSVTLVQHSLRGYMGTPGPEFLAELELADVHLWSIQSPGTSSLAVRVRSLHTAIRLYLNYFWTLLTIEVSLPFHVIHILQMVLPEGFEGRFDLNCLTQSKEDAAFKRALERSLEMLKGSFKLIQKRDKLGPEESLKTATWKEPLLDGAAKALNSLGMCIHELMAILTLTPSESGLKEFYLDWQTPRPRVSLDANLADIDLKSWTVPGGDLNMTSPGP